jgi:hypothetical protein
VLHQEPRTDFPDPDLDDKRRDTGKPRELRVATEPSRPGGLADDLGGDQCAAASGSSSWGA